MENVLLGQKTLFQGKDAGTLLQKKCFTAHILQYCNLKMM